MSPESYDHLLSLLRPFLTKQRTRLREPIPAEIRLAITLRYLASGESQQSLSWSYRVGRITVSKIIRETCKLIWKVLSPVYLRNPSTVQEWKEISKEFEDIWNMPHVLGSIDGKHISIESPKKSGSLYYNYKGFFSIVLLAICDAKYCFTFVDIGQYGSGNDSGVLKQSKISKGFENDQFNIPTASKITGLDEKLPYYLVGDEIFPLKVWLQRPFPGPLDESKRIFNYRLSRARRTIENAFGILAARWRIFRHPIRADVETVESIVQACVCLHNYLQLTSHTSYSPSGFVDTEYSDGSIKEGDWREIVNLNNSAIKDLKKPRGGRQQDVGKQLQLVLKDYVNSQNGAVDWQLDYIRHTGPNERK